MRFCRLKLRVRNGGPIDNLAKIQGILEKQCTAILAACKTCLGVPV